MTGAAGRIGAMLRPRLAAADRTPRLLAIAPLTARPGEEAIQATITDLDAMTAACQGADAVIHLGGFAGEEPWEAILDVNIHGSYVVFEAARRAGGQLPGSGLRLPRAGHLLRRGQGGQRGPGVAVPPPVRAGHHLRAHPDLRRAPADPPVAVDLAVPGRRRAAVRGLPARAPAGVRGVLGGVGQPRGRLGVAGGGPGPGLRATRRRRGLRSRR